MSTPRIAGFSMPAEWAPHDRCWMAWPSRESLWGDRLDKARAAYAGVAQTIAEFEPVTMVCNSADVAEASLACGRGVEVIALPIDDSWMRDTGPSFLIDGRGGLAGVDWRFNGWGEVYSEYDQDAELAGRLLDHLGVQRFAAPIVLEGGAFAVDGAGTVLVTEQCLLDPKRNPDVTRGEMERHLADFIGVQKVIWLGKGYEGDETNGHIDEIACFARPGLVLACAPGDEDDANHAAFRDNIERLKASTDVAGQTLEVVELPVPKRRDGADGKRLTLSYANFYIANGGIVAPDFEDPEDDRAFRILREVFEGRRVVRVPAADIVIGGGGIHCITQQQPKAGGDAE